MNTTSTKNTTSTTSTTSAKRIISHYTGNPMINNALMTIKALASLEDISELTTDILRGMLARISDDIPLSLMDLNLRFKSYTMLFTKNGPLYNDKKLGRQIYETLLCRIVDGFEGDSAGEGTKVCNVTGLRFNKSFSDFLLETLLALGVPEKEAREKDLTINRCWFPLLGGLGSDAQSLPRGFYTYDIHPICVVLLQFLPLSAMVYQGGILLIDSTVTELCEDLVAANVERITRRVEVVSSGRQVENVKDFAKENYVLQALSLLDNARMDYGSCMDLSLWSFSNSGTGARCAIDRLPNRLLNQLRYLYTRHETELTALLNHPKRSVRFLSDLADNKEWFGLYPDKKYEGVSVPFFESYLKVIQLDRPIELARYIAHLLHKEAYRSKSFASILSKTDAYNRDKYNYADELNKVLLAATQQGEWTWKHQLCLLDYPDVLPLIASHFSWHKIIHFYYQKQATTDVLPAVEVPQTRAAQLFLQMVGLICQSDSQERIVGQLLSFRYGEQINDVQGSIFNELFFEMVRRQSATRQSVSPQFIRLLFPCFYNDAFQQRIKGLCSLLRFYFVQPSAEASVVESRSWPTREVPHDVIEWFDRIHRFVADYCLYRKHACTEPEKVQQTLAKIYKAIPRDGNFGNQRNWFDSVLERLNEHQPGTPWDERDLIYNPLGNYSFSLFLFVFKLELNELMCMETQRIDAG